MVKSSILTTTMETTMENIRINYNDSKEQLQQTYNYLLNIIDNLESILHIDNKSKSYIDYEISSDLPF
jgi:hypothetical protein